jgi:antitoxin VapB
MINLSQESEALALKLAAAQRVPVEAAIQRALENEARTAGIAPVTGTRRRMTVEQMLALGSEISALPIRDPRPPNQIMDDLNA